MLEELFNNQIRPGSSALMPGIVKGIVKENWDKEQPGKVRVEYYLGQSGKMVSQWISVMSPYVAPSAGVYFLPEVGTEVIIAFLMGRADCPVVLGSLWSKDVPLDGETPKEKNLTKVIKTRGGHEISFQDEEKKERFTVTTPGGLTVIMDDEKKTVTIKDKDSKSSIEMDTGKGAVAIDAEKKLVLSVGKTAAVTIEKNQVSVSSGTISAEASQSLKLKGQTANLQGSQIQVKADASMKLESGGVNEVKGTMVKING